MYNNRNNFIQRNRRDHADSRPRALEARSSDLPRDQRSEQSSGRVSGAENHHYQRNPAQDARIPENLNRDFTSPGQGSAVHSSRSQGLASTSGNQSILSSVQGVDNMRNGQQLSSNVNGNWANFTPVQISPNMQNAVNSQSQHGFIHQTRAENIQINGTSQNEALYNQNFPNAVRPELQNQQNAIFSNQTTSNNSPILPNQINNNHNSLDSATSLQFTTRNNNLGYQQIRSPTIQARNPFISNSGLSNSINQSTHPIPINSYSQSPFTTYVPQTASFIQQGAAGGLLLPPLSDGQKSKLAQFKDRTREVLTLIAAIQRLDASKYPRFADIDTKEAYSIWRNRFLLQVQVNQMIEIYDKHNLPTHVQFGKPDPAHPDLEGRPELFAADVELYEAYERLYVSRFEFQALAMHHAVGDHKTASHHLTEGAIDPAATLRSLDNVYLNESILEAGQKHSEFWKIELGAKEKLATFLARLDNARHKLRMCMV